LDVNNEGEPIIESDSARGDGSDHLCDRHHLVAGIEQLDRDIASGGGPCGGAAPLSGYRV